MKKNLKVRGRGYRRDDSAVRLRHYRLPQVDGGVGAELLNDNIRLGLDLKGGSHLVLPVQVQDAVKADADQTMERLKDDLKKQNITWASMDVNEPRDISDANKVDDHRQGCSGRPDRRLPQPGQRALQHLPADRAEFHRLLVEVEAHRAGESRARYRAAHHGHHRQPHRPAWPGREGRPAVRRGIRISRFWSSCPAWTIPPA